MARDSFVFYKSFYEAIKKLNKKDQLTVYSHVCRYALGEKTDELDGVPAAIFELIKPQIDANIRRYENGTKGGRPKTEPKPRRNLDGTKHEPNVNVNVNDNVNENVNVNVNDNVNVNAPGSGSVSNTHNRPTLSNVLIRFAQDGREGAHEFWKYNEAKGWIYDFETAYKKWCDREQKPDKSGKPNRFDNYHQREYDPNFERELLAAQRRAAT